MPYLNFDDVPLDPRVTSAGAVDPDALRAKDMGEIGKGWASGRLGNEINTLRSQEASLRADNDVKGGDALNARVQALKQRQGLYAPEVGKVEDIDGFGKAASWLGGQVGQGAASSIDQMATGTAIGGAATLAGLIPHRGAQALSKGLRLAAPAAMYAQNVPLMKGENYDAMTQDPVIMASHTPQELNSMARNSGMAGALLDTAVPGYMAHGLAGGGLKKGLRALNPLQHAAVEMGVEGLNETGQEMIKNRALTELNANRDTSGDNSAYLNSFAGGAAGSSHMALGSSLVDAGFRRVGDTAEKLGTKAGEAFDLAADAASPAMKRGKDAVTDLMSDEDGKVSAAALMDNLKAGAQDMKSSAQSKLDEHNILTGAMPDELMADETPAGMAKLGAWLAQNDTKRAALVVDKLEGMEQDPVALQHLDALDAAAQDPDQYNQAVGAAAEYVLEQTPMGRAQSRADTFGENMGKLASVVGPAVGRGVVATGKAALKFGKSVLSGAQDGMAKKNMQADETSDNPRAELAGGYAADMAQRSAPQNKNLAGLARHLAFSLADMIDSTDTGGAKVMDKAGIDARVTRLNRIVSDFHDIYKKNAPEVLRQLGSILGPNSGEAVTHMLSELEQRTAPGGQRRFVESRDALAQQVVGLVDPAAQVKLMSEGVNLNTPKGREQLLGLMEDYADGIGSGPGARQALDQHFGKESVQSILTLLNGQEEKEKVGSVVDDRQTITTESVDPNTDDEVGSTSDFDQRAAEKTATKGAGPKVYGFHATKNLRTNSQSRDAFTPTRETGEDGVVQRPALFTKGQQLFGGKGDAIAKKIADVKAMLQEDPAYPDHDNYDVRADSALKVMQDAGMQPGKILQLYRDYMRMDYNNSKLDEGVRKYSNQQARLAHSTILDGVQKQDADKNLQKYTFKTGPKDRAEVMEAAKEYFSNKFMVVGEQLSNRDPSKMSVTELVDMGREGKGLIERARLADMKSGEQTTRALSDANILMFKGKDGEVAIPAGKLVNWVRKQRGMSEATDAEDTTGNKSNKSKDDAYLNDVMEGIATLIGTGQVTGMPYKINQSGKPEQFSQGIPESLRLATKTYGAMKFGEDKRREGRARRTDESLATVGTEAYDEKVAADQDKQAEFFSPDDRELREPSVDVRGQKSQDEKPPLVTRTRGDLGLGEDGRKANGPIRVDISGQTATEAKTDASDKTELDFSKKPKDGVPDEYANQRWLSRQTGASTDASIGPEPKGTAASSAKFRAGQIAEAFLRNPAEGQEMIRSRIRSAMRPEYTENKPAFGKLTVPGVAGKDQVVGGVHYIAPVAAFINASELAKANVDLSAATIKAIQSKVANVLIKGDVSKAEQVKIARLMLDGVEKVTSMNVNAVLGRYADGAARGEAVKAKPETVAGIPASARVDEAVLNETYPETVAGVDRFLKAAKTRFDGLYADMSIESSAYDKKVYNALQEWFGDGSMADLESFYPHDAGGRSDDEVRAMLAGKPAPEVANAGLPKGQLTPSGAVNVWYGSGENAELSNLAARPFSRFGHDFLSVEHAYQSYKSGKFDKATYDKYKSAGRKIPGTLGTKTDDSWNLRLMKNLVLESFQQNPKAAEKLAATGNAALTHTQDSGVWAKEFPRILMEVRSELAPVRKLNAMSEGIHLSLGRSGFAATHDSPIRHEGKFDWRAHQGKGEGNAAFGAGTYLSTSDGVHRSYKDQFTAQADTTLAELDHARMNLVMELESTVDPEEERMIESLLRGLAADIAEYMAGPRIKSPTYEVSVDIKPEQLLDWNKPLSEQSADVRAALTDAAYSGDLDLDAKVKEPAGGYSKGTREVTLGDVLAAAMGGHSKVPNATGATLYDGLVKALGSQAKASEYLQSLGILGHKYAAAGGRNDTHPNYVIYDDAKITTNYVHFNAQDPSGTGKVSTQAERDAAKAYANKVFGKDGVNVLFKDITGYSGEFIEATNTIEISTTAAAGTLGTLYHEAMHKFFADFVKGNPKMIATFESLINDPKHIAKLHALLDGYPAAQAQLHGAGSGEERLSYTYQFWKAGLLQVDAKASTWLQKIGKFFRRVLGHVRDSERALELFQAFDNGKMSEPSAAGQVIAAAMGRGGNAMKFRRQFDGVMQGVAALTMPAGEILAKSVSPTARRLSTMMFTNPGEEAHGQEETGLMNARRNVSQQYINITNRKFETMSSIDQNAVQKYLQIEADLHDIPNADHRAAVKDVRAVLDRFHQYMTDAGMKIGKVEKYYPTVWSAAALNDKKAEFIKMLVTKYPQQMNPNGGNAQKSAERIWRSLVDKEGVDAHLPAGREDGVLSPFFASQEMRTLPWLEGADKEKFLEKNMPLTLTRYFSQGAHATEYFRRFGENGKRLEVMLGSINKELSTAGRQMMARGEIKDEDARVKWVSRQMRDVSQSVGAMEGSLGKDVSPNMRKFNSWMAVYQNIRVLPMALFSSFVDPLAMVARGAPMQAAYETFVYGMREVFRGWADAFKDMPPERVKDEWRQLAEHIGASEIAMFQHHVADEYASAYMTSGAKKINDKMFVLNGMEAWNRGNRIMATKWAVRFLEKHAGLPDKNHSERWLAELGLKPSMITLDEGKLVTDRHALAALKGISLEQATKEIAPIHDALNRWVEGAVLTPNAAQRPAWSSDPNWATLFHLKQFSYSFHQTILKRAVNEFKHGNMAPVGALAAFIPTMITADIIKGLIQGGGSLPPYMASMNAGDWFTHGVQRAGLSGIGVIGMDAANDWSSLGGPAFEQIVDAARDGFGSKSALHAMPLNSLYGRMLAGSAAAAPLTT